MLTPSAVFFYLTYKQNKLKRKMTTKKKALLLMVSFFIDSNVIAVFFCVFLCLFFFLGLSFCELRWLFTFYFLGLMRK